MSTTCGRCTTWRAWRVWLLLFQKRFHEGLKSGRVRLTFRRWQKPLVKPGGRYRCHPIGVLEVERIDRGRLQEVTARAARRAGFATREDLALYLGEGVDEDSELWRVALHWGGDGDRVSIALDDKLSKDDVAEIRRRLARLDGERPWTRRVLGLIEKHPRVAASKLAARLGRETLPFKVDVRKLKKLGLTQSFEVGYEVSPRGRAYLAATRRA